MRSGGGSVEVDERRAVHPGCVVPSMITGSVIVGRKLVGAIVCTPAPGMLKWISSNVPVLAFASRIAWRSDPAPLFAVFVTTNVAAGDVTVVGRLRDVVARLVVLRRRGHHGGVALEAAAVGVTTMSTVALAPLARFRACR